MIIVCDIDGTIADNTHRAHMANAKDWDNFLHPDNVANDTPIAAAKEALQRLAKCGYRLTFLTGRNRSLYDVTANWLKLHFNIQEPELYMRPVGCWDTATVFKERFISSMIENWRPYSVPMDTPFKEGYVSQHLFIDDDPYMMDIYLKLGVTYVKAPECWPSLFHTTPHGIEMETAIRR